MNSFYSTKGRIVHYVLLLFVLFLIANSLYLYMTTPKETQRVETSQYESSSYGMAGTETIGNPETAYSFYLSKFYQIMLIAHVAMGIILAVLVILFLLDHLRHTISFPNQKAKLQGVLLIAAFLLLTLSGFFILTESNSTQNRWIFYSHRFFAIAIPVMYIGHRLAGHLFSSKKKILYAFGSSFTLWLIFLGIHYVTLPIEPTKDNASKTSDISEASSMDPFIPFKPGNLGDKESPFYPSASTTTTGQTIPASILLDHQNEQERLEQDIEKYGFSLESEIGAQSCEECHAGIVEQWSKSAHRFSSFNNPFYQASIDNLRNEEEGKLRSQWCGACHDPALLFTGQMREEIDPHSIEAQAGLTCLSCHRIDAIHGKEANGNYNLATTPSSPYLFAKFQGGIPQFLHNSLVKAKPDFHKRKMLKPFFRTSEYCMTCHKVSLDTPINRYRWLRGQNDYDAWHDSGVARNSVKTFYLPQKARTCQDCHMPLEKVTKPDVSAKKGMVKSHTFFSVHTALSAIRDDQESIKQIESFVQKEQVRIDLFVLRKIETQKIFPAIEKNPISMQPGEEIQFDLVVRNLNVGHSFPGGTNDSNEAWIHFTLYDDQGNLLYESGHIQPHGYVDPQAHFYKVLFVDKDSRAALQRDPQHFHTTIYSRVIPPGSSDVIRYRLKIPEHQEIASIRAKASVMWRKFNRAYTEFTFDNVKVPATDGRVPDLPATPIASSEVTLELGAKQSKEVSWLDDDWIRFNDYGNAHFRHEDYRTAKWAFEQVRKIAPEHLDGPRNLARVALAQGNIQETYKWLRECEAINAGDPQTAWFWGMAKKKEGVYNEAIQAFKRVLAYFPEDRNTWQALGRTYYLNGEYEKALEIFLTLLRIDPESRVGHYHRYLCYRALGESDKAAEAQKAYRKYQVDESAAKMTQRYRLNHPADNLASQKIIVYELNPYEE